MTNTLSCHNSFPTAQQNMDFDESLLDQLKQPEGQDPYPRFFRFYPWQQPGITLPQKREVPSDLMGFDIGSRVTGGGIVFHAPGDGVFSCGGFLKDPYFPSPLKEKMAFITIKIRDALKQCGVSATLTEGAQSPDSNLQFCKTYYSPYELTVSGEKVLGITMRKLKSRFIIQGCLHIHNNHTAFQHLPDTYTPYLTRGIGTLTYDPLAPIFFGLFS